MNVVMHNVELLYPKLSKRHSVKIHVNDIIITAHYEIQAESYEIWVTRVTNCVLGKKKTNMIVTVI